jgi:hypothetical protein
MPPAAPCPESLARLYSEAVAARWRGEPAAGFERWLEAYRSPEAAPEPNEPPQAVSLLGGMAAVCWYRIGDAVVGVARGRRGCWWVPVPPVALAG